MKYYRVTSGSPKTTTFSVILSKKNGKNIIGDVTILGVIPRPNPVLQIKVNSYLSEVQYKALLNDHGFKHFVKKSIYVVKEVPFKVLPDVKQREYDIKAYQQLQQAKQEDPEDPEDLED